MSSTRWRCKAWGWSCLRCTSASQQRMEPVGGIEADLHQDSPQRITQSLECRLSWSSSHSDTFLVWCQPFLAVSENPALMFVSINCLWASVGHVDINLKPRAPPLVLFRASLQRAFTRHWQGKKRREAAAAATFWSSQNIQTSGCLFFSSLSVSGSPTGWAAQTSCFPSSLLQLFFGNLPGQLKESSQRGASWCAGQMSWRHLPGPSRRNLSASQCSAADCTVLP